MYPLFNVVKLLLGRITRTKPSLCSTMSPLLALLLTLLPLPTLSRNLVVDYFMTSETKYLTSRCCNSDNTDIIRIYPGIVRSSQPFPSPFLLSPYPLPVPPLFPVLTLLPSPLPGPPLSSSPLQPLGPPSPLPIQSPSCPTYLNFLLPTPFSAPSSRPSLTNPNRRGSNPNNL